MNIIEPMFKRWRSYKPTANLGWVTYVWIVAILVSLAACYWATTWGPFFTS